MLNVFGKCQHENNVCVDLLLLYDKAHRKAELQDDKSDWKMVVAWKTSNEPDPNPNRLNQKWANFLRKKYIMSAPG